MNAAKPETKPESKGAEFRGKIYGNILETIGATPLVRLSKFMEKHKIDADVAAKLEFFNPLSSVKDRIGAAMIEAAEKEGKLKPGKSIIIEPTSGNTGIALAFVAAYKGYRLILVMPETVSYERRKMLIYLGVELILTPGDRGMTGAVEKVKELTTKSREKEDMVQLGQFDNPASVKIHAETTAEEIWNDTAGKIDIFVAGVGTGATITGVAQALKKKKPGLKVYAVEPAESPVLSGGKPAQHRIQGIGAGFVPSILDVKAIDGVVKVPSDKAFEYARELARLEGIPGGISSGAALAGVIDVAKIPDCKGKMIVTIIPSFAERYVSTALFENPSKI